MNESSDMYHSKNIRHNLGKESQPAGDTANSKNTQKAEAQLRSAQ